jgi:hypothetical protein
MNTTKITITLVESNKQIECQVYELSNTIKSIFPGMVNILKDIFHVYRVIDYKCNIQLFTLNDTETGRIMSIPETLIKEV